MLYFSKETRGFYDSSIHATIPLDAVEVSSSHRAALLAGEASGKIIVAGEGGLPILIDPPPPPASTREQIEAQRLRAYADPLTGSDRYFAEAARLQVMGATAEEIDAAKAAGAARYAEIQAQYPWPDDI